MLSQRYLNEKNNLQNYKENNPDIILKIRKYRNKGKMPSSANFSGIIAHLSRFCIFSFMNDGEISHFLKISSAILEFKMSSMDKVLWKLVET